MTKKKAVTNNEAAAMFQEIADVLKMDGVAFKPQAYERAAESLMKLPEPFTDIYADGGLKALEAIPGVGVSIAKKLEELATKGVMATYTKLKKEMPADVEALKLIEGVGVKSIQALYKQLGIKTVEDLEKAANQKLIRKLEGFGAKTEEKILKSIAFHKSRGNRFLLHDAKAWADAIAVQVKRLPSVSRVVVAGSVRRQKETIGDADLLVIAKDGEAVGEAVAGFPEVKHVYGLGETKTMVRLTNGMDLDVRVVKEGSWGAALNYFTGSREHNVALRKIAVEQGLSLNEYGLWKGVRGQTPRKSPGSDPAWLAGKSEEELYKALGLAYIDPELREDIGEIEEARVAFDAGESMPKLVERGDLQGDLQTQSDWTDGKDSIETLAKAAKKEGLSYIAITDHTKRLAMMGGLDAKRLRHQMAEIDKLNKKLSGITILKGTECDILKDGTLDLPDDVLAELDIVGVSIHSFFDMEREAQTKRVIAAISNPIVDILFHPTGKIVGRRDALHLDFDAVVEAAVRTHTTLEVNGTSRLDLDGAHVRLALEKGVKLAVSSDAHMSEHFAFLEFGIGQARRGGAQKRDVINAWPLPKMRRALK